MSSNQALQRVRRRLLAAKGGHAGTLDPMATGMLPLCFGHATKACGQLLGSSKCYRATLRLGSATDTGDAEGSVIREAAVPALERPLVEAVLAGFVGDRAQVPPMYSALKRDGRPLYELAREGIEVVREARHIHIERLQLLSIARGKPRIRGRLLEGHLCACPGRGDRGRARILRAPGRVAQGLGRAVFGRRDGFARRGGAAGGRGRVRCRASCLAPANGPGVSGPPPDRPRHYPGAASSPGARPRRAGWHARIGRNGGLWPRRCASSAWSPWERMARSGSSACS